jgi:hypothetical protein
VLSHQLSMMQQTLLALQDASACFRTWLNSAFNSAFSSCASRSGGLVSLSFSRRARCFARY